MPSSSSSALAVVTGWRHAKSRHTYAAERPSTGCIAAMNGSCPASARCRPIGTRERERERQVARCERARQRRRHRPAPSTITICWTPATYVDSAARHHRHARGPSARGARRTAAASARSARSTAASSTRCDSTSRFSTDTELAVGSAPS